MKNLISVLMLSLIFCLGLSHAIIRSTAIAQVDSLYKSELANYKIGRYVIGSGGIIGARSQNYVQHGTAGQTIVGGAKNANNFVVSGFWTQQAGPSEVSPPEIPSLPTVFALRQNYPNPFNPESTIEYDLPSACLVTVEIFNTVGQRIRLLNSQVQGPGRAKVVWNGRDDQDQAMGSGIYFYRMTALVLEKQTIQFQQTNKMLLVK
jgi:hypothetical protein